MSARNGFNFQAWASNVEKRLGTLQSSLQNNRAPTNGKTGASDLDPREADVLKRAFVGLEQEFDQVRVQLSRVIAERNDIVSLVSGIEGSNRNLESGYNGVSARIDELAYQIKAYTQTVQGIAVIPGRAVPSISINRRTGAPEINPVKVHTKAFWLAANPRGAVTIPANGSVQVTFTVPPEQNMEGDFEIFFLECASFTSQNFRVVLNHTGINKQLMNLPCHGLSVFGAMNAGPQPFQMSESIFLQPNQTLEVTLFDFSGAPNNVELIAHGRKFIGYATSGMDRRGLIQAFARNTWPFWLTTDATIALNASALPLGIQFSQERQFHAEYSKVFQFGTINGVAAPIFYHFQLNEGASGSLLIDTAPILTVAGTSNFPFPLPEPYLALRGTILVGQITNDTQQASLGSDIVFHGRALPVSYPGQKTLEPAYGARNVQLPPSHKDLSIPMMVSE